MANRWWQPRKLKYYSIKGRRVWKNFASALGLLLYGEGAWGKFIPINWRTENGVRERGGRKRRRNERAEYEEEGMGVKYGRSFGRRW